MGMSRIDEGGASLKWMRNMRGFSENLGAPAGGSRIDEGRSAANRLENEPVVAVLSSRGEKSEEDA